MLSYNREQKGILDTCCELIKLLFDLDSYSPLLKYNTTDTIYQVEHV